MPSRIRATTPGIGLFAVFVFVLTAAPRTNVHIGPIPLYLVDVLIVGVVLYALSAGRFPRGGRPFAGIVLILFGFAMLGELSGTLQSSSDPRRHLSRRPHRPRLPHLLRDQPAGARPEGPRDRAEGGGARALGDCADDDPDLAAHHPGLRRRAHPVASSSSSPPPRTAAEAYLEAGEGGVRGRTLVGVSILGATFINAMWPLAALLAALAGAARRLADHRPRRAACSPRWACS